jgi:hypothetical protein
MIYPTEGLFDSHGRLIPVPGENVFNKVSSRYYRLANVPREPRSQIDAYQELGWLRSASQADSLIRQLANLLREIETSPAQGLCRGPAFPYLLPPDLGLNEDIGTVATNVLFPCLKSIFEKRHSSFHFKASLQGQIILESEVSPVLASGHQVLQKNLAKRNGLIGWIFPESLMEYGIDAQLKAYERIYSITDKQNFSVALAGIHDVASALIATPDMLINPETYAPVLCLGGVAHSDPRYFFNFKSYGNHLEFWGMPRALTVGGPDQVSEQWSGVVSIFRKFET